MCVDGLERSRVFLSSHSVVPVFYMGVGAVYMDDEPLKNTRAGSRKRHRHVST
jgi:hypothetical protein